MSILPPPTRPRGSRQGVYCLLPFDRRLGHVVATWVDTKEELFWLAPRTFAPLTAAKIEAWPGPTGRPWLFYRENVAQPLGYLELNPMPGEKRHLWLGHCVIAPPYRGQGLGRTMIQLMFDEAFVHRKASQVSLVVFPENVPAIRCYRSCGFLDTGVQTKYFQTTGRQHRMNQMSIYRVDYESTVRTAAGQT